MCRFVIIAAWCLAVIMARTTHQPHHSHATHAAKESIEFESFRFVYEPHSHNMVLVNKHMCYFFTLSDSERAGVHTDAGMRAIELKLLSSLSTANLSETTKDQINAASARICGNAQHYYIASI